MKNQIFCMLLMLSLHASDAASTSEVAQHKKNMPILYAGYSGSKKQICVVNIPDANTAAVLSPWLWHPSKKTATFYVAVHNNLSTAAEVLSELGPVTTEAAMKAACEKALANLSKRNKGHTSNFRYKNWHKLLLIAVNLNAEKVFLKRMDFIRGLKGDNPKGDKANFVVKLLSNNAISYENLYPGKKTKIAHLKKESITDVSGDAWFAMCKDKSGQWCNALSVDPRAWFAYLKRKESTGGETNRPYYTCGAADAFCVPIIDPDAVIPQTYGAEIPFHAWLTDPCAAVKCSWYWQDGGHASGRLHVAVHKDFNVAVEVAAALRAYEKKEGRQSAVVSILKDMQDRIGEDLFDYHHLESALILTVCFTPDGITIERQCFPGSLKKIESPKKLPHDQDLYVESLDYQEKGEQEIFFGALSYADLEDSISIFGEGVRRNAWRSYFRLLDNTMSGSSRLFISPKKWFEYLQAKGITGSLSVASAASSSSASTAEKYDLLAESGSSQEDDDESLPLLGRRL